MHVASMIQHAQACEHTVSRGCTRQHAVARGCRAPLHCCPSVACSCNGNEILSGIRACCRRSVSAVANNSQYQSASELTWSHPTLCVALAPSSSIILFSCHHYVKLEKLSAVLPAQRPNFSKSKLSMHGHSEISRLSRKSCQIISFFNFCKCWLFYQ